MRFVEDRSIREVAAALDRSEGAVKQLQLRAIETCGKVEEGRQGVPEQGTMADQLLPDRLDEVIDALVARGDASAALRDPELAPLARVAADLRHYPNRDFTTRLRAQLEREDHDDHSNDYPPQLRRRRDREGFTTVTPYVWVPDRGLADFLIRTFDAVETRVDDNPGHGIHRELRIGSSMVMIGETGRPDVPARPQAFHVFVDDVRCDVREGARCGGDVDRRTGRSALR